MRFHLVDRIDAWYPGDRATGIKCVSATDDYMTGPTLPRTVLIESLAQLSSFLLGDSESREGRLVLSLMTGVEQMKFHTDARPGDRLQLDAKIQARRSEGARLTVAAKSTPGNRPICEGRLLFAFYEATAPEQLRDFAWTYDLLLALTRGGCEGDPPHGHPLVPDVMRS